CLKRRQPSGSDDFRNLEDLRVLQSFCTRASKLSCNRRDRSPSLSRHPRKPISMFVGKRVSAFYTSARIQTIPQLCQHVVQIVVIHVFERAHQERRTSSIGKLPEHRLPLGRNHPP